jgi:hypothetical protein
MTNEEKMREVFPKTIFIQRKEEDKTTALMVSDEWLESEYIEPSHEEVKIINNMRRNNPLDMTIEEQIEKVKEEICDTVCKHVDRANEGIINTEELEQICEKECPLRRL